MLKEHWMKRDSLEWEAAWAALAKEKINRDLDEPTVAMNWGEQWQYCGSQVCTSDGTTTHWFRHRSHPKTGDRINLPITLPIGIPEALRCS